MTAPSLTILIPCLNEKSELRASVREYVAVFPQAQILVIDNGSEDATAALGRAAGAEVMIERRRGKATAVASALAAIDTDLVLMVDGDGSYPAEGGPAPHRAISARAVDMIYRHRSAQKATQISARCTDGHVVCRRAPLGFSLSAARSFFRLRLFSRRFYKHVPVLSRGFELEIELTSRPSIKVCANGSPSSVRGRARGSESKLATNP